MRGFKQSIKAEDKDAEQLKDATEERVIEGEENAEKADKEKA